MIIRAFRKGKEFDLSLLDTNGYKTVKVEWLCDGGCGKKVISNYNDLKRNNRLENQYCRKCAIKINNAVEKRKQTCLQKYGSDNPMKVKEIVENRSKDFDYEKQRVGFDKVKEEFERRGYKLLSKHYKNRNQKLRFICPNGHKGNITWSSFRLGRGCNECSYFIVADKRRYSINDVRIEFEKEGYTLLTKKYVNNKTPLEYICPKGHNGTIKFNAWQQGTRCASCSHIISNAEIAVYNFLKPYFKDIIHNNRKLIKPFELDIVIPSKKVAIEYCGLHWHSEISGRKDRNYHLNKLKMCNKIGYRLITIFEDEWVYKQDIVESRLKHILGISDNKTIYARNTEIKPINSLLKNKFLETYHIQGKDCAKIKLGAFYKNELVAVMTFSKGNISKGSVSEKDVYELNRFCTKYKIVGIASKFIKYFLNQYDCKEIFSYSDNRWSDGNLYEKIGFELKHITPPSYWYTKYNNRTHRFNYRKSVLADKLNDFNSSLTEWENMQLNGYDRIWDCGNLKWVYNG